MMQQAVAASSGPPQGSNLQWTAMQPEFKPQSDTMVQPAPPQPQLQQPSAMPQIPATLQQQQLPLQQDPSIQPPPPILQPITNEAQQPPPPQQQQQPLMQQYQMQQSAPVQQPVQLDGSQTPSSYHQASQSYDENRTLWVGDLQQWMEENYLRNCFASTGEVVMSVKVIRNRQTMMSEGYGFVEFTSHASAGNVLQTLNGSLMPQTEQAFRLNWASFGAGERRAEAAEQSIFVGDLSPNVTDQILLETFRNKYQSVKGAKVVVDLTTGRSKGYGFVRFGDDSERTRAMTEMNGAYCSDRPMRISVATSKKAMLSQHVNVAGTGGYSASSYGNVMSQGYTSDNDPNNTTIFVGGLDRNVAEDELRNVFGQFGDIVYVKIPVGKGCGFVQFTQRPNAEEALQKLHGQAIGGSCVRLSWGRTPAGRQNQSGGWGQAQVHPHQWSGGFYGYVQGYADGYGFVQAPQDPAAAYAYGNYGGYGSYPQQV